MTDAPDPAFDALLAHLRASRGLDFAEYKPASIRRRIDKRMRELGVPDYAALEDHLEVHPDEYARLLDTILINVTGFFRDAEAWAHLAEHVVPDLADAAAGRSIRVWSAGCSTGEEPYTVAMLLGEALGEQALRDRVKIYATDVDEGALATARTATYSDEATADLPEGFRDRFFEPLAGGYQFRPELRRSVIFGRHDLAHDAPISRLDLVVCRNVLMYFTRDTQARVLSRLHFGLRPEGRLFLGRAEMLLTRSSLFVSVDLKHRVFSRAVPASVRPGDLGGRRRLPPGPTGRVGLRDAAFESGPTAQLVLDANGSVAMLNDRCRVLFGLHDHDLGRPLRDLEISYRPVDLRSHVDRVVEERRPIQLRAVERPLPESQPQYLDVLVSPLLEGGDLIGVALAFTDVTHPEELRVHLNLVHKELETSYEELQSTNEELETTNEELQSANEELETTNEELQSANEELETMNEELQSASAQQAEVGAELSARSDDLHRANTYLAGILASLPSAVVVVDADFAITVWSARAFEDWGLRTDEVVGRSLMNLDIGLAVAELAEPLRRALDGHPASIDLDATTRRGRAVSCHVAATPLSPGPGGEVTGAVLLIEVSEAGGTGHDVS